MPNPFGEDWGTPKPEELPIKRTVEIKKQFDLEVIDNKKTEILDEMILYRDLNPQQIEKLIAWQARQDLGLSVAQGPLVCRELCIHRETCPLFADNIHPLGKRCPVEGAIMLRGKRKWANSLGINLDDPDGEDAFDLKLLDDLASLTMLKSRALNEMATESPEIAEKVVAGYVDDDPIEKVVLNPRVTLIEKLTKLELKIYSELLSTRKAKFQVAGRIDDLSKRQAELKKKMDDVRKREIEKLQDAAIDVDFEVTDAD